MSATSAHTGSHFWSCGSEHLDWQEVWCFRCRHDHGMSHGPDNDEGPGCDVALRVVIDEPIPEIIEAGYTVLYEDEDGDEHEYSIEPVCNSLPAAAYCTKFELCEPECRQHVNGAVIVRIYKGEEGWR